MNAYSNGTGRPVIFDRIFNQIIDCPVQKDIAACNSTVTFCLNKPDLMLVCNWVQIAENLFCECCKGNCIRTLYSLKTCHVQQDFRKLDLADDREFQPVAEQVAFHLEVPDAVFRKHGINQHV